MDDEKVLRIIWNCALQPNTVWSMIKYLNFNPELYYSIMKKFGDVIELCHYF